MASKRQTVEIEGRSLQLSNLDKVLYPEAGFTKGQVIDYYANVAPALLPHLAGRQLTLKRYPDGVEGKFFYEKNCPKHRPDWMRTVAVEARNRTVNFCVIEDLPGLVWTQNMASLELHTSLHMAETPLEPASLVFDLDPGPPAGIRECCEVALELRALLGQVGLETFAKTSGSKGLQFYAPLHSGATYDATKGLAKAFAELLAEKRPKLVVAQMKKELRKGKVFIDWSQNDEHKTTVCVYSLRAKEQPSASTPVTWEEVEAGAAGKGLAFTSREVIERVEEHGDLFAPVAELEQELPTL
ncbi:MAG: ATP-dependent DNA ligase [Thermoleophilaceae bacterium]|nr:ATP-dependent DNA ligase [Thermoleophilaceae bacterium]